MINGVREVVVSVDDPVTALRFWTDTLGFHLVTDQTYGDERWIEVIPPDRGVLLVLSPRNGTPRHEPGDDRLPHSDLLCTCTDSTATHAELTARGVEFPVPPDEQHFGWWAPFCDPEGTSYALG